MDPYLGEHGNPSGQPQPNVGSGNTLFMDPTISTDDTVGDLSKRKEMLANFNTESERGGYLLIAHGFPCIDCV